MKKNKNRNNELLKYYFKYVKWFLIKYYSYFFSVRLSILIQ